MGVVLTGGLLAPAQARPSSPGEAGPQPAEVASVKVRKPEARRVATKAERAIAKLRDASAGPVGSADVPGATKAASIGLGRSWTRDVRSGVAVRRASRGASEPESSVRVARLGHGRLGGGRAHGVFFSARADSPDGGDVELRVDYGAFANAYGGDWAGRLHLVLLRECATQESEVRCDEATAVPSENDVSARTVTGTVPESSLVASEGATFALMAAASGEGGDFTATPLSSTASWSVGGNTGGFNWSYPLTTPPGIGGPTPDLQLIYSSASVDGRTSSVNNQPSWVGEGFELEPGYVERSYATCADDMTDSNATVKTGDLCWRDDNLTLVMGGRAGRLLKTATANVWRLESDDGSRIERKTGAPTGARDGEYWVLTTSDGTRYSFGRGKRFADDTARTASVSTVPVFGNQSGEPCHAAAFKDSHCTQAWRWGLDHVVDTNDNSMTYFYTQEKNRYGLNLNAKSVEYDRAAVLRKIEYGQRAGAEDSPAPARVEFDSVRRCDPASTVECLASPTDATASAWPDVPSDQICRSESSCTDRLSPTFFSLLRLGKITTSVVKNGGYSPVDEWTFAVGFPRTGDHTRRALSLTSVARKGLVGGTLADASVTFGGQPLPSRVDAPDDNASPYYKWRVNAIDNGVGGETFVSYSNPACTPDSTPAPDALRTNAKRCFPSYFTPPGGVEPQLHFFHKYVVDSVTEADKTGNAEAKSTSYVYSGTPAWALNDVPAIPKKYRTYNDWRGYAKVSVRVGSAEGPKTNTDYLYLRGLDGEDVGDSDTDTITDREHFEGFVRKEKVTLGPGGATVSLKILTPWRSSDHAAADPTGEARIVRTGAEELRTPLAAGGERVSRVVTDYNEDGFATQVNDAGELVLSDNTCTRTTYVANRSDWILGTVAREVKTAGGCGAELTRQDQIISDVRISYDGGPYGTAPTRGNPTRSESIEGGTPAAPVYRTDATTTYDAVGRVTSVTNAEDESTRTSYARAANGATTITTTSPMTYAGAAFVTTSTVNAERGSVINTVNERDQRTDTEYDPLGRLLKVWRPGRSKAAGDGPTAEYAYAMSRTSLNVVTTKRLNPAGAYIASYEFFDGLMRPRSTQTRAAGVNGGRLVTETRYDSVGRVADLRGPFYNAEAPSPTFVEAPDYQTPLYTRYAYDAAGRVVADMTKSMGAEKWRTTFTYGGDRVNAVPPAGAAPTTTVTDVRGNTTELFQYKGTVASGDADITTYSYTYAGELSEVVAPGGARWTYDYDVRGNTSEVDDPDRGRTVFTYDSLDRQVTSTDAEGRTLWTGYDKLGRKTALHDDGPSGTKRASWQYDSLKRGLPTSSTRYVKVGTSGDGAPTYEEYKNSVVAYDDAGRVLETSVDVPASLGRLHKAAGHRTKYSYNPDDSVSTVDLPLAPLLVGERLTYTYDAVGNVTSYNGVGSFIADTVYSPFGEVLLRDMGPTIGKAMYVANEYEEGTRRLVSRDISRQGTATTVDAGLEYGYDAAGNVTHIRDDGLNSSDLQCFKYDHQRRLREAWTMLNASGACAPLGDSNPFLGAYMGINSPYWDSYEYDASGNRTGLTERRKNAPTSVAVQRTAHRYDIVPGTHALASRQVAGSDAASPVPPTVPALGTETFAYDATGNTTSRTWDDGREQTIEWDAEGKQTAVTDVPSGDATSYVYDADGNRLLKRDEASGVTTLYVGMTEISTDAAGNPTAVRNYTLNGELIAVRSPGRLTLLANDAQGTGVVQMDAVSGAIVKRRAMPFGAPRNSVDGWTGDRHFLGKQTDESTGTIHLGAREYDPSMGRFLSVDPIMDLNDPQQMNAYGYANNNPVSFADPTGLFPTGKDDRPTYGLPEEVGDGTTEDGRNRSEGSTNTGNNPSTDTNTGSPGQSSGSTSSGGLPPASGVVDVDPGPSWWSKAGAVVADTFAPSLRVCIDAGFRGGECYGAVGMDVLNVAITTTAVGAAVRITVAGTRVYQAKRAADAVKRTRKAPSSAGKPRHVRDERGSAGLPASRGYRPAGGAADYDLDELAQLTHQHAGIDDLTRPSFDEIRRVLSRGKPTPLTGQNAVQLDHRGVRVIVNEDMPWRSTAYYPGR
ncbi:RHS repeat domain-containing protein [Mumia quercus]|uniref:RHS repeat domain-containing protein n=1 Tax=Mumia quercus TaxID=2976125 RepID=UPI0021D1D113|nr:RHS repeat-associated core domain-containing protein [Mumia quercus]